MSFNGGAREVVLIGLRAEGDEDRRDREVDEAT